MPLWPIILSGSPAVSRQLWNNEVRREWNPSTPSTVTTTTLAQTVRITPVRDARERRMPKNVSYHSSQTPDFPCPLLARAGSTADSSPQPNTASILVETQTKETPAEVGQRLARESLRQTYSQAVGSARDPAGVEWIASVHLQARPGAAGGDPRALRGGGHGMAEAQALRPKRYGPSGSCERGRRKGRVRRPSLPRCISTLRAVGQHLLEPLLLRGLLLRATLLPSQLNWSTT